MLLAWLLWTLTVMVWRFSTGIERLVPRSRVGLEPIRIDLNRAPPAELRLLPGFGPVRARAVVLERVRNGPFRQLADLQRVPGVGPLTIREIGPWIKIGSGP